MSCKSIPTQLCAMLLELAHTFSKYVIIDNVGSVYERATFSRSLMIGIAHIQKQLCTSRVLAIDTFWLEK